MAASHSAAIVTRVEVTLHTDELTTCTIYAVATRRCNLLLNALFSHAMTMQTTPARQLIAILIEHDQVVHRGHAAGVDACA